MNTLRIVQILRGPAAGLRPCRSAGTPGRERGRRSSFSPHPNPLPRAGEGKHLLRLDYLSAGIVPAVRADRVRPLRLLAVRAGLDLHEREREVRAPATLLRLG